MKGATVGRKAMITEGTFKGYVGMLYAADFTDKQSKWHFVEIEVDEITAIKIHPKHVEQTNIEEDKQIDIATMLLNREKGD